MLFCSSEFVLFFVIVFSIYWAMPWGNGRVWLLLGASFYFYTRWNHQLALLVAVSTLIDFLLALGIEKVSAPNGRKFLLGISVTLNLGLLAYFKYANFFLQSVEQTLHVLGQPASVPLLNVIVPIGISFYTFEAINYVVDVYRKKLPAERNLAHFMLFITFFPHLVAGPIVRASDFLKQVRRAKRWNWYRFEIGAGYIVLGLVKKLAISDRMAQFADPVFASPDQYATVALWIGTLAYAIQIYCDFSGYSDLASGTAHLLGFRLSQNFDMPYCATNVAEFWRRWHISLSTWLRDYVYIPLGGSRGQACSICQSRRTDRNLMITMALGGLWHGARWNFLLWGMVHGVFLIVHRRFRLFSKRRARFDGVLQSWPGIALRSMLTFVCVALAWVLFRSSTFGDAVAMFKGLLSLHSGQPSPLPAKSFCVLIALVSFGHLVGRTGIWRFVSSNIPAPVLGLGYGAAVLLALVVAPDLSKPFIYFQF